MIFGVCKTCHFSFHFHTYCHIRLPRRQRIFDPNFTKQRTFPTFPWDKQAMKMDSTPTGFFKLEELQTLQSFEGQILVDTNYYLWLNQSGDEAGKPYRFLYALELIFDTGEALLLCSSEDSENLLVINAATLLNIAESLRDLNGAISIQRITAGSLPLWAPAINQVLEGIRLSRGEGGLFLNDALLLDLGELRVLVALSEREGLVLSIYGN